MFFKKSIAGISALLITASMPGFTAFAAEIADNTNGYRQDTMNAVVYEDDNVQTIECRFYDEMPNVPYIAFSDYYQLWTGQKPEVTRNADGTYTVKVPYGTKGTVNIDTDVLNAEDAGTFFYPEAVISGEDPYSNLFVRDPETEESDEKEPVELDFSEYHIDLRGDETDLWMPVTTLCDIFTLDTQKGFYLFDTLFFRPVAISWDSVLMALTMDSCNYYVEKFKDGRPQDLADYNYNELCMTFDRIYGLPGRPYYTDLIKEKGFDGFLSEGSETTQRVREMLRSTDVAEYMAGLELLGMYLTDGGHTNFFPTADNNEDVLARVVEIFQNLKPDPTGLQNPAVLDDYVEKSDKAVEAARNALYESADYVEKLNTSVYCETGDTAIFSFDTFMTELEPWVDYYSGEGELPQDMVSELIACLKKADENSKIKRFVLDVARNQGGYTVIVQYMMNVLADVTSTYDLDNSTGEQIETKFICDKNLDKQIDEKDKDVKYDLQFGVLTSMRSFSSGNMLPGIARDNGMLLLGETSGGGACTVQYFVSADGMCYSLSNGTVMANQKYESIDNGIQPDYTLFTQNEDGTKDFSASYDVSVLDKCFDDFYAAGSIMRGDVTLDRKIGADDAQRALVAYTEKFAGNDMGLTADQIKAADVNGDGEIGAEDAQTILCYYTEKQVAGNFITWSDLTAPKQDTPAQK